MHKSRGCKPSIPGLSFFAVLIPPQHLPGAGGSISAGPPIVRPAYLPVSYTAVTLAETVTVPERMPVSAPLALSSRAEV